MPDLSRVAKQGVQLWEPTSKPALADSSGCARGQLVFCFLRCFTLWHLRVFQTPPRLSWGRFRPNNDPKRPTSQNKNRGENKNWWKQLTPSLLSTDVGPMWYTQVFKHVQNVAVREMGLPIVEVRTGPVTFISSTPRGSQVPWSQQAEKNIPLLSAHFYQPRPGYLVALYPLHLSDI